MAKEFSNKSFSIDHISWFKANWGFVPSPEQLHIICKIEPGTADLLLNIFSESYLQKYLKKEEFK